MIFKVYTFFHDRYPKKSRVTAYTRWANEEWEGCRVYQVEAQNGAEAKKRAIAQRFLDEAEKVIEREAK